MLNIKKRLVSLSNYRDSFELQKVFEQCYNTQNLVSAGVTASGAVATWSTSSALTFISNGVLMTSAALSTQAVPAAAALGATGFQAVLITLAMVPDYAGTGTPKVATFVSNVGTSSSSAADALSKVIPPLVVPSGTNTAPAPDGAVVFGHILIQSNATAFSPGVTLFNAAGITATAINIVGPFFPVSPI